MTLINNLLRIELVEVFANVGPDLRHIDPGKPPHHWLPVRTNQELLKVPLDVINLQRIPEQPIGGVSKAVSNRWAGVL